MKSFAKPKLFSQLFSAFLKAKSIFQHFEYQSEPHSWCTSEILDCKKGGYLNAKKARARIIVDIQHV